MRAHLDQPGLHLQTQRVAAELEGTAHVRRAQGRVPGERHFIAGCKNSHPRIGLRVEGNMNVVSDKIELARQGLHGLRVERSAVLEHAQRIAAQRPWS
jgi:hypothetical protein